MAEISVNLGLEASLLEKTRPSVSKRLKVIKMIGTQRSPNTRPALGKVAPLGLLAGGILGKMAGKTVSVIERLITIEAMELETLCITFHIDHVLPSSSSSLQDFRLGDFIYTGEDCRGGECGECEKDGLAGDMRPGS
jgi:hypothetical protein